MSQDSTACFRPPKRAAQFAWNKRVRSRPPLSARDYLDIQAKLEAEHPARTPIDWFEQATRGSRRWAEAALGELIRGTVWTEPERQLLQGRGISGDTPIRGADHGTYDDLLRVYHPRPRP